jgi:hypothetical protein
MIGYDGQQHSDTRVKMLSCLLLFNLIHIPQPWVSTALFKPQIIREQLRRRATFFTAHF